MDRQCPVAAHVILALQSIVLAQRRSRPEQVVVSPDLGRVRVEGLQSAPQRVTLKGTVGDPVGARNRKLALDRFFALAEDTPRPMGAEARVTWARRLPGHGQPTRRRPRSPPRLRALRGGGLR